VPDPAYEHLTGIIDEYGDHIDYYTIWSEPDACGGGGIKCIEPADYLNLLAQASVTIDNWDPEAKVAIAPVVLFHAQDDLDALLGSDRIDDVDVIQWHGVYNVRPDDDPPSGEESTAQYYADYPDIVADVVATARTNGFTGDFWSTEITYCSCAYDRGCPASDPRLSDIATATCYARSIVLHLAMDVGVSTKSYADTAGPVTFATLARLNTMLAGTAPMDAMVELDPEPPEVRVFGFTTADGDTLLVVWSDVAVIHPADNQPT